MTKSHENIFISIEIFPVKVRTLVDSFRYFQYIGFRSLSKLKLLTMHQHFFGLLLYRYTSYLSALLCCKMGQYAHETGQGGKRRIQTRDMGERRAKSQEIVCQYLRQLCQLSRADFTCIMTSVAALSLN
jgi:hypothetical protein